MDILGISFFLERVSTVLKTFSIASEPNLLLMTLILSVILVSKENFLKIKKLISWTQQEIINFLISSKGFRMKQSLYAIVQMLRKAI